MGQQHLTDEAVLQKAADNALRLRGDLARYQAVSPLRTQAPRALDGAINALRALTELLEKESSSK